MEETTGKTKWRSFWKNFLVFIASMLFVFGVVALGVYLKTGSKAERFCGDPTVIKLVRKGITDYLLRDVAFFNALGLLGSAGKNGKELKKKIRKLVQSYKFSDFEILKHDDSYNHLLCRAVAHYKDLKGLPETEKFTYYVKFYTKKGQEWVQVEVENQ